MTMRSKNKGKATPAPKAAQTRMGNGAFTGQTVETDKPMNIDGDLTIKGQTNKTETETRVATAKDALSSIGAIANATTLTITTLNVNINSNTPATSRNE